jgi:hypothetical protein
MGLRSRRVRYFACAAVVAAFAATALATACSSTYSVEEADAASGADAAGIESAATDGSAATGDASAQDATADAGTRDATADATPAACPVNEPGLVAYYPFDETAGTIGHDCSGNGHDGVITGGAWGPGEHGGALVLSGAGCMDLGADAGILADGPFTVAAWLDFSMDNTVAQYLVAKATGAPVTMGWRLAREANAAPFTLKIGSPSGSTSVTSPQNQPLGEWLHVAAVFVPSVRMEIWVNGVLATQIPMAPASLTDDPGATLHIGCGQGIDFTYGAIDEVRLYDRALTPTEIAALAK